MPRDSRVTVVTPLAVNGVSRARYVENPRKCHHCHPRHGASRSYGQKPQKSAIPPGTGHHRTPFSISRVSRVRAIRPKAEMVSGGVRTVPSRTFGHGRCKATRRAAPSYVQQQCTGRPGAYDEVLRVDSPTLPGARGARAPSGAAKTMALSSALKTRRSSIAGLSTMCVYTAQ